jgi:hypothetical protein
MLAVAALLAASPVARGAGFDHSLWERVLQVYVNRIGEVDYAALRADRQDLDAYVRLLGESSPANRPQMFPTRADELAYWINAYNAFVVRGVVDHYPTRSVRDIGALYGFFRHKGYTAGGERMSLQYLENDILRKKYAEPRIHFAIVCASVSCPMLARDAYTAGNLEALLERQARAFVGQRRNVYIDAAVNEITLSEILRWYKDDFERTGQSVLRYIRRYASEEEGRAMDRLRQPKIKYFDYDWSINEPGSRTRAKSPFERELAEPLN